MKITDKMIEFYFSEIDKDKFDKTLPVVVVYPPISLWDYIKLNKEARANKDYFSRDEIEPVEDFFYDEVVPLFNKYVATPSFGGGGDEPCFDADFKMQDKSHTGDKWSRLLLIPKKRITINPFCKCKSNNPRAIYVNKRKCKTTAYALDELEKWLSEFYFAKENER